MVTAEMVKNLREKTGAGLMDCKEALTASNGQLDDAVVWLRKKNLDKGGAQNKPATEGRIFARQDSAAVTIGEMSANTDFVAGCPEFRDTLLAVVWIAHENKIDSVEKTNTHQTNEGRTIEERIKEMAGRLKENVALTKLVRYEGNCGYYVHNDNKQGAIVEVENAADGLGEKIAKDIAMHIVFAKPQYMTRNDIPAEAVDKERKVIADLVAEQEKYAGKAKPQNILDKKVEGMMNKFYGRLALMDQPYYRDQKQTVAQVLKVLGDVKIKRFVRFEVGVV